MLVFFFFDGTRADSSPPPPACLHRAHQTLAYVTSPIPPCKKKKKTGGGSLLVVLLETHLAAWAATAAPDPATGDPGLDPAALVSQLGVFVGAHELDDPANTAAVLGVHGGQW